MQKPDDGEAVWIEYPEGRHLLARFDARADVFVVGDERVAAGAVANWSREEHEDYDISDDPKQQLGGKLTRDQ